MAKTDVAGEALSAYLKALNDPSSLVDQQEVESTQKAIAESDDPLERITLRQKLSDLTSPSIDRLADGFVAHARAWADEHHISGRAFSAEHIPDDVLRRAGFAVDGQRRGPERQRSRVTVAEVRQAIPRGTFTARHLQNRSLASVAVVRKVIAEEIAAGNVTAVGPDPDYAGPGRVPTLYRRS